jgi:hypothetical protein
MSQGELLPDVDTMFPPYKGFTGTYSPYFRRKKKQTKSKVQFLSHKDPRKRPNRVMWIRRKTKKRKSRLAKQKYRYTGLGPKPGYHWAKDGEYLPDPEVIKRQIENGRQRQILESEGVETVYRRKPKIVWLRNKK